MAIELTVGSLNQIVKAHGDIFTQSMDKIADKITTSTEKSTVAFKEAMAEFKTMSKKSGGISKSDIKSLSGASGLSVKESKNIQNMAEELAIANNQSIENESRLKEVFSDTMSGLIPGISNVLGLSQIPLIGLMGDIFSGGQDLVKKYRKADIKSDNEEKIEAVALAEENNEELAAQTESLDYIGGLMESIVQDSEANKFQEIEKARESARMQEKLVDAIDGISLEGGSEEDKKKLDFGFFDKLLDSPFIGAALGASMGALTSIFSTVSTFFLPIVAGAAAVYAIYEGMTGAFDGWYDAADKLGKESATTSDKIASAIGGFYGGVWGIADKITGLFGFKTDIGGWVDEAVTKNLAAGFDFVKGLTADIKSIFTETKEYLTTKTTELIATGKAIIDDFTAVIMSGYNKLTGLFDFNIDDLPSMEELVTKAVENISNIFTDIFASMATMIMEQVREIPLLGNIFGSKEMVIPELIPEGEVQKTLIDSGAINPELMSKDIIEDFKPIESLKPSQIQELIDSDNFNEETMKRLEQIKQKNTPVEIQGPQPRAKRGDMIADVIMKESIDERKEEKEGRMSTGGAFVNAPSNINNSSSRTVNNIIPNSFQGTRDPQTSWMKGSFGFGRG